MRIWKDVKVHIFKYPSDYTYCGQHSVDIGTIGHLCIYPTKKWLRRYGKIVCKSCLKIAPKKN